VIQTTRGTVINPLRFQAEDITLTELAHALACSNRFFGHARFPISIAQHAVSVSLLSPGEEKQGLHHDDSEAILGDVNKWLKQSDCFREYRILEAEIQSALYLKFGCHPVTSDVVNRADCFAVRCEMTYAFGPEYTAILPGYGPPTAHELAYFVEMTNFRPMPWEHAERLYLKRHRELYGL
jgi:hypothetical protein